MYRDKYYIINRVKTDLRDEIYDLMTHPCYHSLEKNLTEKILDNHVLYKSLKEFSRSRDIPVQEKTEKKKLFSYLIYREVNKHLGGFNFDRYKSLNSGQKENQILDDIIESLDFNEFLRNYSKFESLRKEKKYPEFVESGQYSLLEDRITTTIKKNRVIPKLIYGIASDVASLLDLDEEYAYIRLDEDDLNKTFELEDKINYTYESLKPTIITVDGSQHKVLLKRYSRTSSYFKFLLTDFKGIITGDSSLGAE